MHNIKIVFLFHNKSQQKKKKRISRSQQEKKEEKKKKEEKLIEVSCEKKEKFSHLASDFSAIKFRRNIQQRKTLVSSLS